MVIGEEGKPQGYVRVKAHRATSRGIELRSLLSLDLRFSYGYINAMSGTQSRGWARYAHECEVVEVV